MIITIFNHFLNIRDKKMDHLSSNYEMTQNQIWSEDPHDDAIHKVWELPYLDGFYLFFVFFR